MPLLLALIGCGPNYPLDDVLRLNHVQTLGTHNSTHIEFQPPSPVPEWRYTHDPLDVQAGNHGVRQFELDVHYDAATDDFQVFHVPLGDAETTCLWLTECLQTLLDWSDESPGHLPLSAWVEPKDEIDVDKLTGHYDRLDEVIRSVWPEDRLFTPDDLRGEHATLTDAVAAEGGWPVLGDVRQQLMLVMLDSGEARDEYLEGHPNLEGRVLFVSGDVDGPHAAVGQHDDPYNTDAIAAALAQGMVVRTRADTDAGSTDGDAERLQAALSSGATWLSTDFPAPVEGWDYVAAIPEGTPARCNPLTAPPECSSEAVEDPRFIASR